MWKLKYDTNQHICETKIDSQIQRIDLKLPRERGWGGKDWETGISRGKLQFIEWINNKVLLYSTKNHIQYPVTNHNGKECEKEYIYVHTTESCCTEKINITF